MNDGAARMLIQSHFSQQAHQVIAFDKLTSLIKKEATVEITVPGESQVGAMSKHRGTGHSAIFLQQRVGYTVGKVTVRLVI